MEITEIGTLMGVLMIGFLFFGYYSRARVFYLGAGAINFFLATQFTSEPFLLIIFLMLGFVLVVFTFYGGADK